MIASDKRFSLFGLHHLWRSDKEKKSFKTLPPGVNVIKLFSFVTDDEAK